MKNVPEKIQKRMNALLAMANDSANEHEAAIATRRLHALLAKYNLSQLDLNSDEEFEEYGTDDLICDTNPWIRILAKGIAELYFCRCHYSRQGDGFKPRLFITGSNVNRTFACELVETIVKVIGREARAKSRAEYDGKLVSSFVSSFKSGAAGRIFDRCNELKQQAQEGSMQTDEGETLPAMLNVYLQAQSNIEKFYEKAGIHLKTRQAATRHSTNATGFYAGREAGDRVNLNKGTGISHNQQRLLK